MPFKDTNEGMTHHYNDTCYRCIVCKGHYQDPNEFYKCEECYRGIIKEWDNEIESMETRADNNDLTNE